ncbi:MAG: hypothetical protein HY904_10190 [Deltaproteobacteria bacterium]|nr:hypothetical protein [Deltaproteobacteria bacterium]
MNNLRLITIDGFYPCAESALARQLMGGLVQLRQRGYGADYPSNYLPLDASDFVCTQHLFVREDALEPVAGWREVSLHRCRQHGLELPLLRTVRESGSPDHAAALQELVDAADARGADVVYASGFTVPKALRGPDAVSGTVKELVAAMHAADAPHHEGTVRVTGSVPRFRVCTLYASMGYHPMRRAGVELPPFHKASAGGEPVRLLQYTGVTDWSRQCLARHRDVLATRLVVRGRPPFQPTPSTKEIPHHVLRS